jgi:hypothetical protein
MEEAEAVYRAAMDNGGEMEAWRAALRADALTGVGRAEEAIALAEWAADIAEERGMLWSQPLAMLAAGRARIAAGREGAREVLDRAATIAEETGAATTLAVIDEERGALSPAP